MGHLSFSYQNFGCQITIFLLTVSISICSPATRVVDFGPKLSEFIEQHPDKNWLIKFYAPWCYHCQQLETTYNNVAEKIYHKHDNLIVGQVDCTKHMTVCEKYGVQAYPAIIFMNKITQIHYKEGRNEAALIDFAERLNGPDIRSINDCNHLKSVTKQHEHIVLSTETNLTSAIHSEFKTLASSLKANWWFYHYGKSCKNLIEENGGIYILKKHLTRSIKFNSTGVEDLRGGIKEWLAKESFPVFGQFNWMNCERVLATGKMMVVAVLDEYKPAKKFSPISNELYKTLGKLARRSAQVNEEDFMFVWSSDMDLIQYITMGAVPLPNVMILKSDYSYRLLIPNGVLGEKETVGPDRLQERSIKMVIAAAKLDDTAFDGGNSHFHTMLRHFLVNYYRFVKVYQSDPLLATILLIFPTLVIVFVLYQTCTNGKSPDHEEPNQDDEGDDLSDGDERGLLLSNHAKQD